MTGKDSIVGRLSHDVGEWAASFPSLLTGERDMQVRLAMWLEAERGWTVYTEYRVPLGELTGRPGLAYRAVKDDPRFPWPNDISVDIVVGRDGRFAAVELKYATRSVLFAETLFDEPLVDKDSLILKDQGAADLVMYNYWKDVRRIEALASAFPALEGGVALIMTNNRTFRTKPAGTPSYIGFATFEGNTVGGGSLRWGDKAPAIKTSHPDMELSGRYTCRWAPTAMPYVSADRSREKFHYMIQSINQI